MTSNFNMPPHANLQAATGGLSKFQIFNQFAIAERFEGEAQAIDKFNAQSANTITMMTRPIIGSFYHDPAFRTVSNMWDFVDANQTTAVDSVDITQYDNVTVKTTLATPPIRLDRIGLMWTKNPREAGTLIGEMSTPSIMRKKLNGAIGALVAAIGTQSTAILNKVGTKKDGSDSQGPTIDNMIEAESLLGDHGNEIAAWFMHSRAYAQYLRNAVTDQATVNLFSYEGINVMRSPTGKVIVITDAPALEHEVTLESKRVKTYRSLGLTMNALEICDQNDLWFNADTNNGFVTPQSTYQGVLTMGLMLKGYSWKTSAGSSPTLAKLQNSANWEMSAIDIKFTSGVRLDTFKP